MMDGVLVPFLAAAIRTATPLAFAALGELVSERAGVLVLALEGAIIAGCLGALVAADAGGLAAGFAGGMLAGMLMVAVFAAFVVGLGTDQVITGTAVTMLAFGITGTAYRTIYGVGGAALEVPTLAPLAIPGLSALPVLGPALFVQPLPTYALYLLVPGMAWWMTRTHAGLALRATGEHAEAAAAAGIAPARVRVAALLFTGAMGGLCGATLVLAQVGTFAEGMSAGRGFIAIAIVVLGRWTVNGTAGAALLFGAAFALQYLFQGMALGVPYQFFIALPYLLTLGLLAISRGRAAAPAGLGRR